LAASLLYSRFENPKNLRLNSLSHSKSIKHFEGLGIFIFNFNMAHEDIEVEVKFFVSKEDFLRIKKKLQEISRFVKTSEQSDEYFNIANRSFLDFEHPFEWLSIRKRGGKNILNYKNWYNNTQGDFTHCDEFEVLVDDSDKLTKIFSLIDIKSIITVDKTREVYNYCDELEIDMDYIKELGYFIEIESLKDFGSIEEARKRIFELAKELGINELSIADRGYAYMLMKKRGLTK
jgi:predicted adenylyl cyclase CyaB